MRQHFVRAYRDQWKWVRYCAYCSLEDGALEQEPVCVGRYVSPLTQETIKKMEDKLDTLKSIF